jgi:hypothetical protein
MLCCAIFPHLLVGALSIQGPNGCLPGKMLTQSLSALGGQMDINDCYTACWNFRTVISALQDYKNGACSFSQKQYFLSTILLFFIIFSWYRHLPAAGHNF